MLSHETVLTHHAKTPFSHLRRLGVHFHKNLKTVTTAQKPTGNGNEVTICVLNCFSRVTHI